MPFERNRPKVSIIVAVYNRAQQFEACIQSLIQLDLNLRRT